MQRNVKSRMTNSSTAKKTTLTRDQSRSNFEEVRAQKSTMVDIDITRISTAHFTESDRRNVMNRFMANKEIMFLIFGLMFPYKTLLAAKKEPE